MSGSVPETTPETEAAIARVRADVARLHGEPGPLRPQWTGGNVSGRVRLGGDPGDDLFV